MSENVIDKDVTNENVNDGNQHENKVVLIMILIRLQVLLVVEI